MRLAFVGCVAYSARFLELLLAMPGPAEVVGVATRERSAFNADFLSLAPLAAAHGRDCLLVQGNDQEALAAWLRRLAPDVVYCFGWSNLLRPPVLAVPRLGVIGFHPTALPLHRGRHPIIWALALGLAETASTFFFMDEGADSGDILDQRPVPIRPDDDAASLYDRIAETACGQIAAFTPRLAAGDFVRTPQDPARATSWRRRTAEDGEIDWRMPAQGIYDLVRALARPYPGAHCRHAGREVKIWRAAPAAGPAAPPHLEPGKVLAEEAGRLLVKCGQGALWIEQHEFEPLPVPGSYL